MQTTMNTEEWCHQDGDTGCSRIQSPSQENQLTREQNTNVKILEHKDMSYTLTPSTLIYRDWGGLPSKTVTLWPIPQMGRALLWEGIPTPTQEPTVSQVKKKAPKVNIRLPLWCGSLFGRPTQVSSHRDCVGNLWGLITADPTVTLGGGAYSN